MSNQTRLGGKTDHVTEKTDLFKEYFRHKILALERKNTNRLFL